MSQNPPTFFDAPTGTRIGYYKTDGKGPTVVFFGGLMSDMTGTKATFLEGHCREIGQSFLRFDYGGHGASSGKFEDGTIGLWHADALAVLDYLTEGPLVIVGSSMGGWQVLLAALARPDRVKGLIGLAAAPDFTERLLWGKMDDAQKAEILEKGFVTVPHDYDGPPYKFTKELIEDGQTRNLLDKPIPLDIPIRLIHGMQDKEVPFEISLEIMAQITSKDAELVLIKEGNHKLSSPSELKQIKAALAKVLEKVGNET